MACSQCQGIESFFGRNVAARELRRYRRKGPPKTTRLLLEAIEAEGVQGASVLDVGGGVGVIQQELLRAGAAQIVSVDASTSYLEAAREEAQRRGTAARIVYRHGDFVDLAPSISAADVVTLDKVICCYADVQRLVSLTSQRARRLYCLVYPQQRWYVKLGARAVNLYLWLRSSAFRVYVHPSSTVSRILRENGLERRAERRAGPIWQIELYRREGASGPAFVETSSMGPPGFEPGPMDHEQPPASSARFGPADESGGSPAIACSAVGESSRWVSASPVAAPVAR